MEFIYFSGLDLAGNYRECYFGDETINGCFELLSALVNAGWQLTSIKLIERTGANLHLPVEAFDGIPMQKPLERLQQEWEEILVINSN